MAMVNDPRARIMAQLREKFHKHNQCLFWVGRLIDDLNAEHYEEVVDSGGATITKPFPAMGRGTFNDVIDQLEKDGICTWKTDVCCDLCGWGWEGKPSRRPIHCGGCGDPFEYETGFPSLTRFVLDRPWAEARRWS